MKKLIILNNYKKKINLLKKYNKFYYDNSDPIVSDKSYDELKKEILNLEEKYKFLKSNYSPSETVGFKPSKNFKKINHKVGMLSLANAFTKEDLENFEKRILNYLGKENSFIINYTAEPKIDGISASLTYKNGKFIRGLSRGDGKVGENITENLKTIDDIPKEIKAKSFPKEIDIRGEVFITNSDFLTLGINLQMLEMQRLVVLDKKIPMKQKKSHLNF